MIRNRAATRERLLGAAEQLLIKKGFQSMGINAVAARAGIDKVLIYRYFGGFEGLLESLATEREIWPKFTLPEHFGDLKPCNNSHSAPPETSNTAAPTDGIPLSRIAADQVLWEILQANVQTLKKHPLALEVLVWSCAESNVLTRAQARLRRRQTRKLKEELAQLSLTSSSLPGGDAPTVYTLLWKAYCFALMENHRKETYKPKDWRLFDQAGLALFHALPAGDNRQKKKKKSDKHKSEKKAKSASKANSKLNEKTNGKINSGTRQKPELVELKSRKA